LVVTLRNSAPIMDNVTNSLLNEEPRRKDRGLPIQSKASFVDNCGRNENCGRNKGCDKSRGDLNLALNLFDITMAS